MRYIIILFCIFLLYSCDNKCQTYYKIEYTKLTMIDTMLVDLPYSDCTNEIKIIGDCVYYNNTKQCDDYKIIKYQ